MKWRTSIGLLALLPTLALADNPDPTQLIKQAYDNWRGSSSYAEVSMTVHRPEWERTMTMASWTRGDDDALVRFTAPAKNAGNATLKLGDAMWMFNPRLNQILKLPASMMAQSWMGSDFSYNDLAKANELLTDYRHKLLDSQQQDGHTVYRIEALPKPDAATVWGKQEIKVRDDGVMMAETYFDQDMQPVKLMTTDNVATLDNRPYPVTMTMHKAGNDKEWTRIHTDSARFDINIPDALLTQSNLRNPRPFKLEAK